METAIQTKDLTKEYRQGKNIVMGVDHVNISVASGEFTSIVGRSGSGKSTLLHLLGGIDQPTAGSVLINGININQLQDAALTKFRSKHIGFIFQSYNLINELTVLEIFVCRWIWARWHMIRITRLKLSHYLSLKSG